MRATQRERIASQVLLAIIAVTNVVSVGLLINTITAGRHIAPTTLLVGRGEIWLTNTVVFALCCSLQAVVSLVTVALIAARAVNILPGS